MSPFELCVAGCRLMMRYEIDRCGTRRTCNDVSGAAPAYRGTLVQLGERERAGICSVVSYLVSGIASVFPPPTAMFGDNLLVGVTVMSCPKLMSLREVKD